MTTYFIETQDYKGEHYDVHKIAGRRIIRVFNSGRPYRIMGSYNPQRHNLEIKEGQLFFDNKVVEPDNLESLLSHRVNVGSRIIARPVFGKDFEDAPPEHAYGYLVTGKVIQID